MANLKSICKLLHENENVKQSAHCLYIPVVPVMDYMSTGE